jgi:hypothetical protein
LIYTWDPISRPTCVWPLKKKSNPCIKEMKGRKNSKLGVSYERRNTLVQNLKKIVSFLTSLSKTLW